MLARWAATPWDQIKLRDINWSRHNPVVPHLYSGPILKVEAVTTCTKSKYQFTTPTLKYKKHITLRNEVIKQILQTLVYKTYYEMLHMNKIPYLHKKNKCKICRLNGLLSELLLPICKG